MKIKLYIPTYNNAHRINTTIGQLAKCEGVDDLDVVVINNHSNFDLDTSLLPVTVLHNQVRPDFSTGHLSRTWNQCIINGFESLTSPACDILVTAQDDTYFHIEWIKRLIELHERFEFVQNGHGDHICSYTPEHVRKVGLWDERFCGISRQAADYFFRCLMYNHKKSSINDPWHQRIWNPIFPNDPQKSQNYLVDPNSRQIFGDATYPNDTDSNGDISLKLIEQKFGFNTYPWNRDNLSRVPKHTKIDNYILYPYFEKDVYDLKEKRYVL